MKKLTLIFTLTIFSLGAISTEALSMGFPYETYAQEKLKSNAVKKVKFSDKTLISNVTKISNQSNDLKNSLSFVEMIVDFVAKLFCNEMVGDNTLKIRELNQINPQFIAIKNEYEITIITQDFIEDSHTV